MTAPASRAVVITERDCAELTDGIGAELAALASGSGPAVAPAVDRAVASRTGDLAVSTVRRSSRCPRGP